MERQEKDQDETKRKQEVGKENQENNAYNPMWYGAKATKITLGVRDRGATSAWEMKQSHSNKPRKESYMRENV